MPHVRARPSRRTLTNHLVERDDVEAPLDFEENISDGSYPQLELAGAVEHAGRLDGIATGR